MMRQYDRDVDNRDLIGFVLMYAFVVDLMLLALGVINGLKYLGVIKIPIN